VIVIYQKIDRFSRKREKKLKIFRSDRVRVAQFIPTLKGGVFLRKKDKVGTHILHRLDGPALEYGNGYKEWHIDGLLHREDGPAVTHMSGTKIWYKEDKRHRMNGPAVEWYDGKKEWWYKGNFLNCNNQEIFERLIRLKAFW